MKHTRFLFILLVMVFTSCLLNACNEACDTPVVHPLKDLQVILPYSGYDTLRFLHNNTDTVLFVGQGIQSYYITERNNPKACEDKYESSILNFRQPISGEIIKIKYEYSRTAGGINPNLLSFSYNGKEYTDNSFNSLSDSVLIGHARYNYVSWYFTSNKNEFLNYHVNSATKVSNGILKIRDVNDSLEVLK